jgi:hypothetical protein
MVDRHGAAAFFGIKHGQWAVWERTGRAAIPRYGRKNRNGPPTLLYAVEDLERLREQLNEADRVPPELVSREEAAALFDLSLHWWGKFESLGRMPVRCVWVPSRVGPPRKAYPRDELLRFREEYHRRSRPHPDPERPGCCRVPLTSKAYAPSPRAAIIDAESLPLVEGKNWHWEDRDDGHVGCVALAADTGPNTPMKRRILGLEKAGPGLRVSHANGDPLDCRRANLVVETIEQQVRRTRKKGIICGKQYTSQYKGVSWDEPRGMWKVQISYGGMNRFVDRCYEEVDAAYTYDAAARKHFGEDASLNFPCAGEKPARAAA